MKEVLIRHLERFSEAQIKDLIKLVYQATFGPRHALENPSFDFVLHYLEDELNEANVRNNRDFVEDIGGGYVRVDLAAVTYGIVSAHELADLFYRSMLTSPPMDKEHFALFRERLELIMSLSQAKQLPYSREMVAKEVAHYLESEFRVFHHSDIFRALYHPHYRVIMRSLLSEALWNQLCGGPHE